ncbi:MAG TPA: hypothetical protein VFX59_07230 [Polyangiales bacterium]|nr:hypothetical protein [Polyangiales bacterium]
MDSTAIPKPVREFVCKRIHAIEQLEILLLLHADRAEAWTARSVAAAVRIGDADVADALRHLSAEGLLIESAGSTPQFKYAPVGTELGACVDTLAEIYARSRLEVLQLISRGAMDRIRTAQVRAFASAFLFRDPRTKDRT